LELTQSKDRILELYLNVAEFGRGVYGINAASKYYFGVQANAINPKQAAYLAAALPWPERHNFNTGSKTFYAHANRIYARSLKEHLPRN
jgi:monofunctional biosynthetic peptidoglycan transglycosylase